MGKTETGDTAGVDEHGELEGVEADQHHAVVEQHGDLGGVEANQHHDRPEPGDNITESNGVWSATGGAVAVEQPQYVTSERDNETWYQNTTGGPLIVTASADRTDGTNGRAGVTLEVSEDTTDESPSHSTASDTSNGNNIYTTISRTVPDEWYYLMRFYAGEKRLISEQQVMTV